MKSIKSTTSINNKITNNFEKGFKNILSPTLINLFIILSLILILLLVYIKYKKIELFNNFIRENFTTTVPNATLASQLSSGYIESLLNNYMKTIVNKLYYQDKLDIQENTIQSLSQKVNETLNPPS